MKYLVGRPFGFPLSNPLPGSHRLVLEPRNQSRTRNPKGLPPTPNARRRFFGFFVICALILSFRQPAAAQGVPVDRVEINHVDTNAWPRVSIFSTALGVDRAVLPPEALNVQVFEDGAPVTSDVSIKPESTGLATIILLDLSGSMTEPGVTGRTRFEEAQQAALDFVNTSLQDGDLVGVVGFATDIYDGNLLDLTGDRAAVASMLQQLTPESDPARRDTALWDATLKATQMFEKHPDLATRDRIKGMRRAVVAFTDGADTASKGSRPGDLREWAKNFGVAFHTVALKSAAGARLRFAPPEDEDSRWLADQTRGLFFDYGNDQQRAELPAFLSRLAGQRQQLRISYPSSARDGSHNTRVVVSTGDVSQEASADWFGGGKSLTAAITHPAPGASFGCAAQAVQVPISVTVQLADGQPHAVDKVEFYDNDRLIGTATASPYSLPWDVNAVESGQHLLQAWLHDATLDEVVKTPAVAVQVAAPQRPELELTQPAAGSEVVREAGATLLLEASVDFPDGCRRPVTVRFRGDGDVLAELASPPFRHQWDISELPDGQHQASAEAIDSAGSRLVVAGPVAFTVALTALEQAKKGLIQNWPAILLGLGLLFLLVLLLRTRRQVGKAVGGAVARVRQTMMGSPTAKALGTLEGVRGPAQGRTFRLTERINTVGRDPQQCEVAIRDDGYISTKHFCIEFTQQGAVVLTDLGSRHGTAVNGQPLQPGQPMALRGGERIRAGESEFEFQLPSRRSTQVVDRS